MALPALLRPSPASAASRAVAATAAALLTVPLVTTAQPAQAAPSAETLCASMDTPVHLGLADDGRTLLSTSASEIEDADGYDELGVALYAATTEKPGLDPVYEMVKDADGTRLYVMGTGERDSARSHGFRQDSVAFYASPTANSCTEEVVRFTVRDGDTTRYAQTANWKHRDYLGGSWGNSITNFFTRELPDAAVDATTLPGSGDAAPAPAPTTSPAPAPSEPSGPSASAGSAGAGAGAKELGTASYPVPSGALFVAPGGKDSASGSQGSPLRTLEEAVSRVKEGQTIVLREGVYNASVKFFVDDVTIQNYPGEKVWLDGSAPVTGITKRSDGRYQAKWNHEFNNADGGGSGWFAYVGEDNKMAAWPDQVFVDGKQWWQVESNPGPGQFARDYDKNLIVFGSRPDGDVRASNKKQAMFLGGRDITIQGIGVRRYANGIEDLGMIYSMQGGLTMRNVHLHASAVNALNMGHAGREGASLLQDLTITEAGMAGIGATSIDDSVIERVLITDANWAGFNQAPGGAGMKILRTRDVTIRDNDVRGTDSTGIWLDESVAGFRVVNNRVTDGQSWGIMAELSGDGVIADNYLVGNSSGINIYNTHDTDIVNNVVDQTRSAALIVQQDERRQSDPNAPGHDPRYPAGKDPRLTWVVDDVNVTNNVFGDQTSEPWFLVQVRDKTRERDASEMDVRFSGNGLTPRSGSKPLIGWGDTRGDFTHYDTVSEWQSAQSNVSKNVSAPSGRSGAELDDWAADTLPAVTWPSRARDYLGRGSTPGFDEIN